MFVEYGHEEKFVGCGRCKMFIELNHDEKCVVLNPVTLADFHSPI